MAERILVVANKWFEIDPLVAVFSNAASRPEAIQNFNISHWPKEIVDLPLSHTESSVTALETKRRQSVCAGPQMVEL
jgi:hypothetical protein